MKHINTFAFLFSLAGIFAIGCSSSTTPPSPSAKQPIPVTIHAHDSAQFYTTRQDSTNQNIASKGDTVNQRVADTNATAYGKTGVRVLVNVQKSDQAKDTTYLWQDANGNVWRYNYGVELLNTDPAVQGLLHQRIDVGWVLLDSTKATAGNSWLANASQVAILGGLANVTLNDNATYVGDTSMTVSGKTISARHIVHTVVASGPGNGTVKIDTYFSPSLGTVLNIVHTSNLTVNNGPVTMLGIFSQMTWHN